MIVGVHVLTWWLYTLWVLQYLRMNTIAGGREAIALVLSDIVGALRHAVSVIRRVIVEKKFGSVRQTRDFLALGEESNITIKRGLNLRRRKCDLIFIDSITSPMREQLKAGMFELFRDARSWIVLLKWYYYYCYLYDIVLYCSDAGVRREQAALSHIHYIILCTQALVYN